MTAWMTDHWAALNIPGNKPELEVAPEDRGDVMLTVFNDAGVGSGFLAEAFDEVRADVLRRRNWKSANTPGNNRTKRRGIVGNEIIWRARFDVLGTDVLNLRWTGNKGGLNLPVIFATKDDATWAQIGVHLPTKRVADFLTRDRLLRAVVRRAVKLHKSGLPVILGGDWNRPDAIKAFPRGWRVASQHGVDTIIVSPTIRVRHGSSQVRGVKGVISDHPMVSAVLSIPVKKKETP